MERAMPLSAWESFYVIVGSSGAALTGLQFVVMTLIAADDQRQSRRAEVGAFGTPTIVHFCAALLVSAIFSAPWPAISSAALALAACGGAGVVYVAFVIRRATRTVYKPVLEDWIWHSVLPLIAYALLLLASLLLVRDPGPWLFVIGATALLLLFIGIHNAWDTVTYLAVERPREEDTPKKRS